jgi:LmbE family N-acetylglucosaminyl deacetylase
MGIENDLKWNDVTKAWVGNGPLSQAERVLIVVAHPDDLESQAAGAVVMMTRAGAEVHLVLCTSGDKGSGDRSLTSADIGPVREAEQRAAAGFLGIRSVEFLRWPDGEVEPGRTLRESIVKRIRLHRPDIVITHDPVYPWPVYRAHRDHRNVGQTVLDAIYPDARDHLAFPEHPEVGLEPHITCEAWLIMSSQPDWIVDISEVFDEKVNARLLHRSQTGSAAELRQRYADRAATIGRPVGFQFAEALTRVRFT